MRISADKVNFKNYDTFTLVKADDDDRKIIEFKKSEEPIIHEVCLRKLLNDGKGIFIPPLLREKFENRKIVALDDPEILDVFLKVIYPNYACFDNYCWEAETVAQKEEPTTFRFVQS